MALQRFIVQNNDGTKEEVLFDPTVSSSIVLNEVEIDYGLTPVTSKEFVITDVSVTNTKKITISLSPNPATDRVGNDWAVDQAFFSALAGTGDFTLYSNSQYAMVGKRKIYYQVT